MPIYEYRCDDCGTVSEFLLLHRRTAKELTCSQCQSPNLTKLLSAPSAVMTGNSSQKGATCCGREERCDTPPCSSGGTCSRD